MVAVVQATAARDWPTITLGEEGPDGFHRSWVMMLPEGKFDHPTFGKLDFSHRVLTELKQSFDENARGIDIALDYDHKASEGNSAAPGWIECVEYRPGNDTAPAGLWARVRWTRIGLADVKDQTYRYVSAEVKENYTNEITGKTYKIALLGLALTNRPFMKQMPAIALAEVSSRAWGSVDKKCLPSSAFMDPKNRRLPIYEGTGPKDAQGRYTKRGKLNIHGLEAALAAVHGAHTGKAMTGLPAGTVTRIERLAAAHGLGGGGDGAASSKAASEGGGDTMGLDDSEHGATVLKFMGGSTTEGSFVKQPMGAHDESDDMKTESAELADGVDDGEMYDDGDGADGEDGADDDGFDKGSNRHGPMTTDGHTHGKYAEHSHDGDADHSDVPMASKKSMAEGGERGMTLSEQRRMVEEHNQMRRQLAEYAMSTKLSEVSKRMPGRAMSKVTREAISGLMLSDDMLGVSQALRDRVWRTIELALTKGTVDMRSLGSAHDAEARRTVKAGEAGVSFGPRESQGYTLGEGRTPVLGLDVLDVAEKIALDEGTLKPGQTLLDLPNEQRAALLVRAGKQQG